MRSFLSDLRHGLRLLANSPGLSAAAVLALALGIGVNTAIFSVVYAVLLRPLSIREPDRVVAFQHRWPERDITLGMSGYCDLMEWKRTLKSYEEFAGFRHEAMNLSTGGEAERVFTGKVTATFFPLIGAQPSLGRNFTPEEDRMGAGRAAILTDQLWQRRFGGSPDVIGATLKLEGEPYTVVGVLPKGFRFIGDPEDLYVPLAGNPTFSPPGTPAAAIARLKPGVTRQQADAELGPATAAMVARIPPYKGFHLQIVKLESYVDKDVKTSLYLLLGGAGLILLIACANVASLLLSRAVARRHEMAVRAALGAGRWQLLRQMLGETLPLAAAGAVAGVLFAFWCIRLLPLLDLTRITRIGETGINLTVLGYAAAITVLTCLLCGLLPALWVSRVGLQGMMKEGARAMGATQGARLRSALVIAEVAFALVLSIGAILMVRTVARLAGVDPGFDPSSTLTASIELPREKARNRPKLLEFYRQVRERVRAVPGIQEVTITNSLPLGGNYFKGDFRVQGREYANPQDIPILWLRSVDAGYAKTLRTRLLKGRFFEPGDRQNAPRVAVVNETAARRMFGGQDPVGRQVVYGEDQVLTIAGVVSDVKHMDVTLEREPEVLLPIEQEPFGTLQVAVRVDPNVFPDAMRAAPMLRHAVAEADPNQAVARILPYEKLISDRLGPRRLSMGLLGSFALLAILLAAIGIYGLLSFTVARRTNELGIRMALGAEARDLVRTRGTAGDAAGGCRSGDRTRPRRPA